MMTQMLTWSTHENEHVRRLSSEGCRPRLPWGMGLSILKKVPAPILPILENLKQDPALYVRRSVANNLNDIAKDHPDLVLATAKRWIGTHTDTNWIVKHACRTLLKQGNTDALKLFGFGDPSDVEVQDLHLANESVSIGDDLHFSFSMSHQNLKPLKLRLEYGIDYMKSNGKTNRKIFQVTENTFKPGEAYAFSKKQSFRNMTTRKHYPGLHRLAIVVNGVEMAVETFEVF